MKEFKTLTPAEWSANPFTAIGRQWMLITAEKDGKANTMTASWGGVGVLWGKNVAFIFVRKSRYTKEFIDGSGSFSLSFFDTDKYRKMLSYMGSTSGRDADKIAVQGLTVAHADEVPYFEEAQTVLLCRKLACQPISRDSYIDPDIMKFYGDEDWHDLYVGEITGVLQAD